MSSPPNNKPLTQSEHFYFEDGNIVLAVEDVAFRVHQSQLSRHSKVFCDMMEVAVQPPNAELFDECSVVQLFDTPKDVLELLRVLYDYVMFDPNKTDQLTSVLRLSTKYSIDRLCATTIECLSEVYPATLEKYDRYHTGNAEEGGAKCWDVIKLAHEVHAEILLPTAYYHLCRYPVEQFFTIGLSQSMLQTYFLGKEKIATKLGDFVKTEILHRDVDSDEDHESPQHPDCYHYLKTGELDVLEMLTESSSSSISMPNPLYEIQELTKPYDISKICTKCRKSFLEDIKSGRQEVWSSLPGIFDIGSWQELLKTE